MKARQAAVHLLGMLLLLVSALALVTLRVSREARAATPSSATFTLPTVGQPQRVSWTGGPLTNPNPGGAPVFCVQGVTCDTFNLTLNIPANAFSSNTTGILDVKITWTPTTPNGPNGTVDNNDLDLFITDPNGNQVALATAAFTTSEETFVFNPIPGTYQIQTVAFNAFNQTYAATATFSIQPETETHFSPPTHLIPGKIQSLDAEPAIRANGNGDIFVTTNRGLGGGIDAWRIEFPKMARFPSVTYLGQPDGGLAGGGDTDEAIAPQKNAKGFYNAYMSSLSLVSATLATTMDNGASFTDNFFSTSVACVDRQWNAADFASTVFLVFHDVCNGNNPIVVRSDQAGATGTFTQIGFALDANHIAGGVPFMNWHGRVVVDPTTHIVYVPIVDAGGNTLLNFNHALMAVSTDGGKTFTDYPVFTGPNTVDFANSFPTAAVDTAGNVYMAWVANDTVNNTQKMFFTSSTDHGRHWILPVQVNQATGSLNGTSGDAATAMLPWIAAGCNGRVDAIFYGTPGPNNSNQNDAWQVYFAQTLNGTSATPSFTQTRITGTILVGPFDRRVLDDIQIDIDPTDGMAVTAYTGGTDQNTYFSKQIQGVSALACQ